jgi:hypothetical protein
MSIQDLKEVVKIWRTINRVRQANKLAEAIKAYEKSKITKNTLSNIFSQLYYK